MANEIYEQLELFFSKSQYEKVKPKLEKFKEDQELMSSISQEIAGKEIRNITAKNIASVINALENIVMHDYPVENPVQYYPLYSAARDNARFKDYAGVLAHLSNIKNIEGSLVLEGIQKNTNFGGRNPNKNYETDMRPYIFSESSYLDFIRGILSESRETAEKMLPITDRLARIESHLKAPNEKGINIMKLLSAGYIGIIKSLDSAKNKKSANNFEEESGKILGLLKTLDEKGFDIYQKSSISTLSKWVADNQIDDAKNLIGYLSPEALIYVTGMRLKNQ